MHQAWVASMNYFNIPQNERQAFYDWYQAEYPDGLAPVSRAYEEWKKRTTPVVSPTVASRNVFESTKD